jgi:hypothetical protein
MRPSLGHFASSAALALAVVACQTKSSGGTSASASTHPAASSVRVVPPRPALGDERPEIPLCRVIAVRPTRPAAPDAGIDPRAPAVGVALEGRDWLTLGPNTEVVLRHAMTTRELALRGPGRFLPCFQGTETVLVATGSVKTTAGAGARAGAEVILATPLATLHFADAALELGVGERALDVSVEAGVVTLVPATSATKASADAGVPGVVLGPRSKKRLPGSVDLKDLVARCGDASRSLGTAPPAVPAGVPSARALLGQWSVEQLRARQAARWACAAARAAIGREQGPEQNRRWDQISALDKVWQSPPPPPPLGAPVGAGPHR